jgi:uncharacterized protein YciI
MMEFLYVIRPTRPAMLTDGPTEAESEILTRHARYVEDLAARGVVELAGRTQNADETAFGIVIFHAESKAVARRIMDDDPAVAERVMTATLFPYRIAFRAPRSTT